MTEALLDGQSHLKGIIIGKRAKLTSTVVHKHSAGVEVLSPEQLQSPQLSLQVTEANPILV